MLENLSSATCQGVSVFAPPAVNVGSLKDTATVSPSAWQSAVTGTVPAWKVPFQLRSSSDAAARPRPASPAAMRTAGAIERRRSEEHTSELQSRGHLVCRLLLEKTNRHSR